MNAIRDWLHIGKYSETLAPALLASHNIKAMLQLAELVAHPGVECLYLPVDDGVPLSSEHLRQGINFILAQKQNNRRVLVACGAGMSRSAAFALAALKEDESLSLLDALKTVKQHHPDTMVHPALWKSLCAYYQENIPIRHAISAMTD